MHRHSLRPDLFPLVEPDSDSFLYDCDFDLGGDAVAGGGGDSDAGDAGGAGDAGDASVGGVGAAAAPPLLLAMNVLLFLVLCAGVGALGASNAFAESMGTLTKNLQAVGSAMLDLLRVDACADCCGVSCVCAYVKCVFSCLS